MMVRMVRTTRMEMAVIQREEGKDCEGEEEGIELDWTSGEGGENGELATGGGNTWHAADSPCHHWAHR